MAVEHRVLVVACHRDAHRSVDSGTIVNFHRDQHVLVPVLDSIDYSWIVVVVDIVVAVAVVEVGIGEPLDHVVRHKPEIETVHRTEQVALVQEEHQIHSERKQHCYDCCW